MGDPSSSCSFSPSSSLPTDVFLSFRGEDTRNSFVCHLHSALERETLQVYIDKQDLQKGDNLSNLLEAIAGSKVSVVVFSEKYATSTWCLQELVKILECKEEQNQIVIPVFYRVDPSDIRHQRESFAKPFAEYESIRKEDNKLLQEVKVWRLALKEVTNFSGWDSKNFEDDLQLINAIVKDVFDKVHSISISPHIEDGKLVAMDSHLHEMRQRMKAAPDGVVCVGICGMGGIGKTTVAEAVFEEIAHQFEHRCFLEKVREGFMKGEEVQLQLKLLSKLYKKEVCNSDTSYMKRMIRALANKKILVVLDDVRESIQMDALLGADRSFGAGSIIIVTTRDEHVVLGFEIYKLNPLSESDSLKLFSQYAFKTYKPFGAYEPLSICIVDYAQGLPLALKVLGAFLCGRSLPEWIDQLRKLRERPHREIKEVLQISFDGLDEWEKDIFLDIACFFKGMEIGYVTIVLGNCGFYPVSGLKTLVQRALVTISDSNKLEMHDLLQEMGRHIESSTEDGKRKRFWGGHVERVLTENSAVAEDAEGLMIALPAKENRSFNATAFERMRKLRLLMFSYSRWGYGAIGKHNLIGDFNFLSRELRVLIWHRYPLQRLPSSFDPRNLVHLDMHSGHIEHLWEGSKRANNLRIVNLIGCPLKETPDFTEVPNLQTLVIGGDTIGDRPSFTVVHPSIFAHQNLVFLSLARCQSLKTLPRSIFMKSLQTLDLTHCLKLEMFPEISEDMDALSVLSLYQTAIKELPSSIERLRGLQTLDMTFCSSLIRLPDSICNLEQLRSLKLSNCSKLSKLPENIGYMKSLLDLQVGGSGLEQLPVSILRLKFGAWSSFSGCKMAAPFSSWPSSIEDRCIDVVHLNFSGCNMMELSDAIACFPSLKVLRLSRNNLEGLPAAMKELGCLERIEVDGCKRLRSIPELPSTISYINAHNCIALETVSAPQSPYEVGRCFIFTNCSKLVHEDVFTDIVKAHITPQGNPSRPFYFSCPGNEIPEQFNHQSEGTSVTVKLPPHCFGNKILGFAISVITNNPQGVDYDKLILRCFFTFKGDQCQYRSSFCLFNSHFDSLYRDWLESSHMLVGYVPWSEFGIHGEEVNERHYTEAKIEIELFHSEVSDLIMTKVEFDPSIERRHPCIERWGVRFFFANNEDEEVIHQDFGEPTVQVLNNSEMKSLEGRSADPSGSEITCDTFDEEEQRFLKLSEVFEGANRKPSRYMKTEDNEDSSGKRVTLKSWKQKVKVTSGLKQGYIDDGFNWSIRSSGIERCSYQCDQGLNCGAKAVVPTPIDPTILEVTYVRRHTCWKALPMLTHQVRITPDMDTIGGPFDGFRWTKYDERDILGSRHPREYYVCDPEEYGGCMAVKEVQKSNDQRFLRITYTGRHTCTLPSTGIVGRTDSSTSVSSASSGSSELYAKLVMSLGPDIKEIADFLNDVDIQRALRDQFARERQGADDMENNNNMAGCLCWFWSLWNFITSKEKYPRNP